MANLTTNECYERIKEVYNNIETANVELIIQDICNCFDSNRLTEFVEFLNDEYELNEE